MSNAATMDHADPLTLEKVYRELQVLRQRVEDIEDLHDLEEAIVENVGKPSSPGTKPRRTLSWIDHGPAEILEILIEPITFGSWN